MSMNNTESNDTTITDQLLPSTVDNISHLSNTNELRTSFETLLDLMIHTDLTPAKREEIIRIWYFISILLNKNQTIQSYEALREYLQKRFHHSQLVQNIIHYLQQPVFEEDDEMVKYVGGILALAQEQSKEEARTYHAEKSMIKQTPTAGIDFGMSVGRIRQRELPDEDQQYIRRQKKQKVKQPASIKTTRIVPSSTLGAQGQLRYPSSLYGCGVQDAFKCAGPNPNVKPLRTYQKRILDILCVQDAVIAAHPTGSGKSITAMSVIVCWLHANPSFHAVYIGPKSVKSQFHTVLDQYQLTNDERKHIKRHFELYNPDEFLRIVKSTKDLCENILLVIDEAHLYRTQIMVENMYIQKGLHVANMLECSKYASKLLILTATPIVNSKYDLNSLINIASGTNMGFASLLNVLMNITRSDNIQVNLRLDHVMQQIELTDLGKHIDLPDLESEDDAQLYETKLHNFILTLSCLFSFLTYDEIKRLNSSKPDFIEHFNVFEIDGTHTHADEKMYASSIRQYLSSTENLIHVAGSLIQDVLQKRLLSQKMSQAARGQLDSSENLWTSELTEQEQQDIDEQINRKSVKSFLCFYNVPRRLMLSEQPNLLPEQQLAAQEDEKQEEQRIYKQATQFNNPKMRSIITTIKDFDTNYPEYKHQVKKFVVFSEFLDLGLDKIEQKLKEQLVGNKLILRIDGTITDPDERLTIVNKFNKENQQYDFVILLISRAASEGIDLKRAHGIFLLEPLWNKAAEEQIKGRVIRLGSHEGVNDAMVHVYHILSLYKKEIQLVKKVQHAYLRYKYFNVLRSNKDVFVDGIKIEEDEQDDTTMDMDDEDEYKDPQETYKLGKLAAFKDWQYALQEALNLYTIESETNQIHQDNQVAKVSSIDFFLFIRAAVKQFYLEKIYQLIEMLSFERVAMQGLITSVPQVKLSSNTKSIPPIVKRTLQAATNEDNPNLRCEQINRALAMFGGYHPVDQRSDQSVYTSQVNTIKDEINKSQLADKQEISELLDAIQNLDINECTIPRSWIPTETSVSNESFATRSHDIHQINQKIKEQFQRENKPAESNAFFQRRDHGYYHYTIEQLQDILQEPNEEQKIKTLMNEEKKSYYSEQVHLQDIKADIQNPGISMSSIMGKYSKKDKQVIGLVTSLIDEFEDELAEQPLSVSKNIDRVNKHMVQAYTHIPLKGDMIFIRAHDDNEQEIQGPFEVVKVDLSMNDSTNEQQLKLTYKVQIVADSMEALPKHERIKTILVSPQEQIFFVCSSKDDKRYNEAVQFLVYTKRESEFMQWFGPYRVKPSGNLKKWDLVSKDGQQPEIVRVQQVISYKLPTLSRNRICDMMFCELKYDQHDEQAYPQCVDVSRPSNYIYLTAKKHKWQGPLIVTDIDPVHKLLVADTNQNTLVRYEQIVRVNELLAVGSIAAKAKLPNTKLYVFLRLKHQDAPSSWSLYEYAYHPGQPYIELQESVYSFPMKSVVNISAQSKEELVQQLVFNEDLQTLRARFEHTEEERMFKKVIRLTDGGNTCYQFPYDEQATRTVEETLASDDFASNLPSDQDIADYIQNEIVPTMKREELKFYDQAHPKNYTLFYRQIDSHFNVKCAHTKQDIIDQLLTHHIAIQLEQHLEQHLEQDADVQQYRPSDKQISSYIKALLQDKSLHELQREITQPSYEVYYAQIDNFFNIPDLSSTNKEHINQVIPALIQDRIEELTEDEEGEVEEQTEEELEESMNDKDTFTSQRMVGPLSFVDTFSRGDQMYVLVKPDNFKEEDEDKAGEYIKYYGQVTGYDVNNNWLTLKLMNEQDEDNNEEDQEVQTFENVVSGQVSDDILLLRLDPTGNIYVKEAKTNTDDFFPTYRIVNNENKSYIPSASEQTYTFVDKIHKHVKTEEEQQHEEEMHDDQIPAQPQDEEPVRMMLDTQEETHEETQEAKQPKEQPEEQPKEQHEEQHEEQQQQEFIILDKDNIQQQDTFYIFGNFSKTVKATKFEVDSTPYQMASAQTNNTNPNTLIVKNVNKTQGRNKTIDLTHFLLVQPTDKAQNSVTTEELLSHLQEHISAQSKRTTSVDDTQKRQSTRQKKPNPKYASSP